MATPKDEKIRHLLGYSQNARFLVNKSAAGVKKGIMRNIAMREHDMSVIASLYLRGKSMREIADMLNEGREIQLTDKQIYYDLRRIRDAWLKSTMVDFNAKQARELAKLDELERAYWLAWEHSLEDIEESTVESVNDAQGRGETQTYTRKKAKKTTRSGEGQAAYLLGIERCIAQRCKILGLSAPQRYEINWRKEAERAGIDPDILKDDLVSQFVEAAQKGVEKSE